MFADDPFYRDARWALEDLFGADAERHLARIALICFKPDAIASDRVGIGLDFLANQHLVPAFATLFQHDRFSIREVWRYQLSASTRESLRIVESCLTIGPSLVVLCVDRRDDSITATERLLRLKGNANPAPGQLRHRMRMTSVFLSLIHTPDHAEDLVRELGIYFPRDVLTTTLRSVETPMPHQVADAAERAKAITPPHDLSIATACSHVRAACKDSALVEWSDALARGYRDDYLEFFAELAAREISVDRWDAIVIAAHHCRWPQP